MKCLTRIILCCIGTFVVVAPIVSQDASVSLQYNDTGRYYFVERANLSRYDNGKYTGLTHRETRASVSCQGRKPEGLSFTGTFFVLEETLRDMTASARGVDAMQESSFIIKPNGGIILVKDNGYPAFRDFPVYPEGNVQKGDKWQAEGTRIIDPRNDGKRTALPILVEYTFAGAEVYQGRDVYRIKGKYATRINQYRRLKPVDPDLANATGTHDVDILVSADTGSVVLILDRLDETFSYKDGSTIRFRGSAATFTEIPAPYKKADLMRTLVAKANGDEPARDSPASGITETNSIAKQDSNRAQANPQSGNATANADSNAGAPDVPQIARANGQGAAGAESTTSNAGLKKEEPLPRAALEQIDTALNGSADALDEGKPFVVEDTPLGVRLSARNVRFLADSDDIVPEEKSRLDVIAGALAGIEGGKFLVEGHTASVGRAAGEKDLSVKRAKKIVDELVKRGLRADQFIYAGYGGTKPVADNATDAGRAKNRRVEITILQ